MNKRIWKYAVGEHALYRWDGWESVTILQRRVENGMNYYRIDIGGTDKIVHEGFLY